MPREIIRALLTDVNRRPNRPRDPLPDELTAFELVARFELDEHMLARNLRTSRRGAAGGPSGMTTEHLRPLLDDMNAIVRRVGFSVGEGSRSTGRD